MENTQKDTTRALSRWDWAKILAMLFAVSGIFGFIYETIFYRIDLGYFVKRSSTWGPWIPIYGYGGLLIFLTCWKLRRYPVAVFFVSGGVCGGLEFLMGYMLWHLWGMRAWDYNTEIWNWGNIGGYVCLRSVLFFAASGLMLIYLILPGLQKLCAVLPKKLFGAAAFTLAGLFFLDIVLRQMLHVGM